MILMMQMLELILETLGFERAYVWTAAIRIKVLDKLDSFVFNIGVSYSDCYLTFCFISNI